MADTAAWPAIPLAEWEDTLATLHRWSQVIGKVKLMRAPLVNHWWGVTFHLGARGWTTGPIPHRSRTFEVEMDFLDHHAVISSSDGRRESVALRPRSVADFHREVSGALEELDLSTPIRTLPCEIEEATPLDVDETHRSYDADAAQRFWRAALRAHHVLEEFRARFVGKCSPVHFFWGGFDLAVTRFTGRAAPPPTRALPGYPLWANAEAYSHECSSAGFWPGQGFGQPAFYSYAYPEPAGFAEVRVEPDEAAYSNDFGQFLLPYEAVRTARDPARTLLAFFQSTYDAAASRGAWDRAALERKPDELEELERSLGRQR